MPTERKRSTKEERIFRFGHPAAAVWVQGRPHVAEMVERQMFDEGWHVQMAGPNDFLAHELVTVAKAFRLSGNITIFAPLDDGTDPKERCPRDLRPGILLCGSHHRRYR